jgi:GT2 family glycosyltransferase
MANTTIDQPVELSIILVNWNTREMLLACLRAIAANPPARGYEVWVVDNDSSDGSVEAVRQQFPEVRLIANERNVGFAAANNLAIARCDGRYVLLLNSDTEVHAGALEAMCSYLDNNPRVGAVGCTLQNPDGSIQRSAWRGYPSIASTAIEGFYLWKLFPEMVARSEVALARHTSAQEVDHLLGACIMSRREVITQVGALDDDYFLFLEETDWCRRIQAGGWKVIYLPGPSITHYGQQSMRQIPAKTLPIFYASLCRFVRKSAGPSGWATVILLKLVIALTVLVRMALWTVRLIKQRTLGLRMIGGYGRVLRQLPSF